MRKTSKVKVKFILLGITLISTLLLTGCSFGQDSTNPPQDGVNPTQPTENTENNTKPAAPVLKDPAVNPLTGLLAEKSSLTRRPLAIMIENSPPARPHSGLDRADIVYEVLSEGGITRFMAIFYAGDAGEVGPVRSARPYFLARSEEFDAVYVHAGGSPEALSQLKKLKIADLDQFGNNYPFWRSKARKAPHNLYGNTEKMRTVAEKKWPGKKADVPEFEFLEQGQENPDGEPNSKLTINYANKASMVEYRYNAGTKLYERFNGGREHRDAVTKQQYTATNIIVQYAGTKVTDKVGRLQINMVGSGTGFFFTHGMRYNIEWSKTSRTAPTRYKLAGGQKLLFNPGQTWIQVVPKGAKVTSE